MTISHNSNLQKTKNKDFLITTTPGRIKTENGPSVYCYETINAILNKAERHHVNNLLIPNNWDFDNLKDWTTKATGASTSFTVTSRHNDTTIRLWVVPSNNDPKQYRKALLKMLALDNGYTTGGGIAIYWLRGITKEGKGRTPQIILKGPAAEAWSDRTLFFNPAVWGANHLERKKLSLTQWDRNKSFLPAISQAIVAPLSKGEDYQAYGNNAPISKKHAGMYFVTIPEWPLDLPSIYGKGIVGDKKWVDSSLLRLQLDLQKDYPIIPDPIIHEAWLAPAHSVQGLRELVERNIALLETLDETPEERGIAKNVYKSAAGAIGSPTAHTSVHRPDWEAAIKTTSWVNVLRAVYKEASINPNMIPTAINVDAVYYSSDLPTPSTFKIGKGYGQYKRVEE